MSLYKNTGILLFTIFLIVINLLVPTMSHAKNGSSVNFTVQDANSTSQANKSDNIDSSQLELIGLRIEKNSTPENNKLQIIAVFNHKPDYKFLLLNNPPRIIVNLPSTHFSVNPNIDKKNNILESIRYGGSGENHARLIFTLRKPFRISAMHLEPLNSAIANSAWQINWELEAVSEQEFEQYLKLQGEKDMYSLSGNVSNSSTLNKVNDSLSKKGQGKTKRDNHTCFTVAIDAGHGGFDSGTIGVGGSQEKDLVLAFAQQLAKTLEAKSNFCPFLTRDSDNFLRLNRRVEKAREAGADLFISIHADHISMENLKGATVYTLSNEASDDMAKLLAEKENKADLLDGLPPDKTSDVSDILVDMTRRETRQFSQNFSQMVVNSLKEGSIALTTNPQRSAGFQVLRAADIPSVLLELGYLSNKDDEEKLDNPIWKDKVVNLLVQSIKNYAKLYGKQ